MAATITQSRIDANARSLQPDSLATSIAILLIVSVVQRGVGFGRSVLFCRWLAPEELGQWDMAYSFLLMAAPVVVLGLPGSFGRYLERYRQRQQLRTFLRRTAIWTAVLAAAAVAGLIFAANSFSELIFGQPNQQTLVVLIAVSLIAVILHHFLEALFAVLRKFRIVSAMQFCQSMVFAIVSLSLMWWWRLGAESIVIGYGIACLVSATTMLVWTGRGIVDMAAPGETVRHVEFWPPLLRFAIWIWFTNLLSTLFAVVDRYMLVHCSGLSAETALAQVGNYHSSRVVPLLLVSLADLLSGVVMPYLSHDWERGQRRQVSDRLNLVLKLTSLGMLAASVAVLWAAPILFHFGFRDKYNDGLAVLPWTLTYCVWYALLIVAQNFIWCAEKTKIGSLPLACGLVLNILINFLVLPIWGLLGAVAATTFSTAVALAVLYWLNRREGMQLQPGLLWLSAAPAALCGGVWPGTIAFVALTIAAMFSRTLFTNDERAALAEFTHRQLELIRPMFAPIDTGRCLMLPEQERRADRRNTSPGRDAAPFLPPPRPLRVMFLLTSMPVGGAETLLVDLVRRLDRRYFQPEIGCLKEPGPLGEMLAQEMPVHHGLLSHKFDLRIWPRLTRLLRERQIDAVVTVGAGDKMFWGRLAARRVGVPVIMSALHSTGWPDGIGRLNRMLTPITDAFVAVADSHGAFLVTHENLPIDRVVVIPNGVDTNRFAPLADTKELRSKLGIGATDPTVVIVAALRPEKNHELFLEMARRVSLNVERAHFLIVGDGPQRESLEELARELAISDCVHFLGSRPDVPEILAASDVFALTSHNEANPVSILEAMSVGRPVVATNVGSIREVIHDGRNGFLVEPGNAEVLSDRIVQLLREPARRREVGDDARRTVVEGWSVDAMVRRYEQVIASIYARKVGVGDITEPADTKHPPLLDVATAIAATAAADFASFE